jgi:hypothetical protein
VIYFCEGGANVKRKIIFVFMRTKTVISLYEFNSTKESKTWLGIPLVQVNRSCAFSRMNGLSFVTKKILDWFYLASIIFKV